MRPAACERAMKGDRFQFIRFLCVGVVNTLTGLAVIYACKWWLQFGDVAANATGYAVGLVVSFTLNSRWTFRYDGPRGRAIAGFAAVAAVAYAANLATVMLCIHAFGIDGYIAQAIGVPAYTITSYLANKHFVFTSRTRTPHR